MKEIGFSKAFEIQNGTLDLRNQLYSHAFPFGSRLEEVGYHHLFLEVEYKLSTSHNLLVSLVSTDSYTSAHLPLVMARSPGPRQQGFLLISI